MIRNSWRSIVSDGYCVAVEARDLAPVLDGVVEDEPGVQFPAAELAGPAAEQFPVQLRPPVVDGPDTAESGGRGRRRRGGGADGAEQPRQHNAAAVHGVQGRRGGVAGAAR